MLKKVLFLSLGILTLTSLNLYAETKQSSAKTNASVIEIAQSVPIGTTLGEKDIRPTETVWVDMMNDAKSSIDIGSFYFENKKGEALEPVVDAIINAAGRGVKVRVLVGAAFYPLYPKTVDRFKKIKNIEVGIVPYGKIIGGVMHAKYMVVDNENSYVGSANFGWTSLSQIHNLGIRVRNKKIAATILQAYNLDWKLSKTKNFMGHRDLRYKHMSELPVTVMRPEIINSDDELMVVHPAFSPPALVPEGLDFEQTQMVEIIANAHHELVMQVLTFSPAKSYGVVGYWTELDDAIRAAAARGVKVKFILSNWNNKKPNIDYAKSLSMIPNVEIKISSIPKYKDQFIPFSRVEHCKYLVVDNDLSWVGTGNWEWGYFNDCRDITLLVKSKSIAKQLRGIFFKDWAGPYVEPIDVTKDYVPPKVD